MVELREETPVVTETEFARFYMFLAYCKGCGLCISKCPRKALGWSEDLGVYGTAAVVPVPGESPCNGCGLCAMYCPDCAIAVEKK